MLTQYLIDGAIEALGIRGNGIRCRRRVFYSCAAVCASVSPAVCAAVCAAVSVAVSVAATVAAAITAASTAAARYHTGKLR
ncbi:MAG: hypothetical protein KKG70_03860 [Proteobacteria bacterium]|nr:hypothetical protein [Pseudomonadota bacterium]